ncbi:hypothetical protein SUGI_0504910 [Cryptomeria japonica]|uniref:uncharacterized protein LOC131035147 isoform X1 n=1 Tax=Cryptomeria japonica TaxID=3369 RepID=UPI002408DD7B|nr:uncharacterized protein LOC131035147 isoform X1 [Cryptomeria japonica]GLJ26271.1 hypothetical protein SUGI_0504910 [Cryptomeria japonica]
MDTKPVKRSSKKEKRHHKIINISDDSPAVLVETGSHEFNTRKPVFENKEDTPPKKRRKKSLHSKKTDISQLYEQDLLKSSETVEDDMPTKVAEVGLEDVSSLSLMRCLHNKDLPLQRKIQLAHLFVESVTDEQQQQQKQNFDFIKKEKSWMGMPQLVSLMCYWIQSVLISSTKQNNTAQNSTNSEKNACLDVRCWVIFKWCLQSKYLERASFPSNLMRTINSVLSAAAAFPGKTRGNDSRCPLVLDKPIEYEAQTIITGAFMKEFAEVVRLLFSLHGRYIRLTLDLWASSALGAASLAERVLLTGGQDDYDFVFPNLTCLVLEEFARYLASHSNPRNVFPVIVEKLFEPLLSLLVVLEREQNLEDLCKDGIAYTWRIRLARILEDIFSFGLFHPVHIDGYLNVCKIGGSGESQRDMKAKKKSKSASSREREREDSTATFASYHKSLFQKLEYLRKEGKATALHGIGRLLSIYICRKKIIGSEKTKNSRMSGESLELINTYKQQQEIPHSRENSSKTSSGTSKNSNMNESKHTAIEQVHTSKHDQATVKPLFNLFVEFMDPLQMDVEHCENVVHLQETQKLQQLSCAHSTLVAINGLLFVVKDEKLFVPTEDTPEQAHFNYLKKIYNTVFKLGALVPTLCLNVMEGFDRMGSNANGKALRSKLQMLDPAFENLPTMIMKEIVLALSYLLEIEYRVADGELFDLWLLLLSYSAMNSGKNKKQEQSSMLNSQIVYLGCRIIIIYGELRQVDRSLFRLFESIRLFIFGSYNSTIEKDRRMFLSSINSFPSTLRVEAVLKLVCSQGFLNVVADVVSSVPEGQVSKFIKQLKADVSETLEWMKNPLIKDNLEESQIIDFQNQEKQVSSAQAEVIGKAFSELYTLILDKSNVTLNNSKSVGKFVEDIVICVSLCLASFVEKTSDSVEGLWQCILSVITGKEISENNDENKKMQARILCGSWILVFIFRLYLSSRSLFRQCISFMPPNSAKESSLAMGDSLTAYSGNDWIKEGGNMIGGYFSWIGKSSIAVQSVLIAISETLEQVGFGKASALMYVLHTIALQRLVDLNRHIKALEFLYDKTARLNLAIAANNDVVCTKFKKGKKLEKLLKVSRQEASTLTDFILNYTFSFVENKFESKSCLVDVPDNSSLYAWDSIIGTMDEYSLVTAVWQLVCQNVDIWSDHASKKSKKKFVSILLESLLSFQQRVSSDVDFQSAKKQMGNERKIVTIEDTSSELLENDVLYEQEFFCRYLAVKICQKIRKSLPSKLNHLPFLTISPAEADFGNLQDWPKFINILEEVGAIADFEMSLYENTKNYKNVSTVMPVPVFTIEESQAITSCNRLFGDWINLLNLLCWLPKGYGDVKSASIYARHILNIERFLMTTLYQAQKASHSKPFAILQSSGIKYLTEFLDLFSACRRALKSITLSCNDDEFQVRRLSLVPILFESSSSCLWLLMSVDVVAKWFSQCSLLQPSLRGDQEGDANPWKHLIYSILDHTAGMLMIVCEGLFNIAAKSLTFDVQCTSDICKGDKLIDNAQISATDPISERNYMDVKTSVDVLAKTLSVQARDTLAYFKQISFDADQDSHESIGPLKSNCNRMNYPKQVLEEGKAYCRSWIGVIALTGGIKSITWGLASALNDLDEKCRKDRTGSLKWQNDLLVKWEHYGEGFECFVNFWIKKLLIVDSNALDEVVVTERDVMSQHDSKATFGHYRDAELTEFNREVIEARFGKGQDSEEEEEKDEAEQNGLYGGMDKADDEEGDGDAENDSLLELHASKGNVQHATFFEIPYLNKPFLEKLLKGKNPDQATLLGELFMVLAGIIKLKHLSSSPKAFIPTKNSQSTSLAFMNFHIGAAHWLISEASIIMTSGVFSLGWLVGIVRYLESIGSFIPYMNPTFPPMAYAKLINLHLQAMAAVSFQISLEIKNSVPEEVQFSNGNQCSSESTIHRKQRDNTIFNDLKTALRSSFSMLLKKPLQLHLVMALQSIERALTGAWTGYNIASQLNTGCQSGGNVGLIVAAGVECLDLTLDSVSGPKRMKLLAKYSSGFVAALLNVIMHLQGPQIFFVSTFNQCQERNFADPASVILVCVEVLSKFVLRHEVFAMRASHVGQSLALPGVLFQHLCQFKPTQCVSPRTMPLQNQARDFEKSTWLSGGTSAAVRKVSVELCISCCRLLCALLTNYGRESGHCISLLGDSLRIFLFCLEIVDLHTTEKLKAYCWTMQEGIKCACWLRRVYEEMGQHKTLGRYRVHILSDYISVVSGCGPAKSGLKREIDEALRSGAYALVHACSREDLQQLHVVLGEGPHRIALQTLINDCERYYNYKGKI